MREDENLPKRMELGLSDHVLVDFKSGGDGTDEGKGTKRKHFGREFESGPGDEDEQVGLIDKIARAIDCYKGRRRERRDRRREGTLRNLRLDGRGQHASRSH